MTNDISTAVTADFSRTRTELESMIKIPSVSAPGYDDGEVRRSADFVAGLLTDAGCDEVRLLEIDGAHPAVYAVKHGPTDAPTVLLYAHHDVQPPGPDRLWDVPPFDTVEIDGRLYGRGSADDKCGIAMHLSTLRVFGDAPPVTIKVLAEGEEEIGSLHLVDFLDRFADELAADVIVIADGGNWKTGVPALATSLRGLVDCTITVRTLAAGVHSGQFGGVYPDANMALVRTLAALHADDGSVAVPGLHADTEDELEIPHDELIEAARPLPGVEQIGSGSVASRSWRMPAISILGIDSVPIAEAINQIVPEASAKVSMRIPPGQDPTSAMTALHDHLVASVPWGCEVSVTEGAGADAFSLATDGSAYDAFRTGFAEAFGTPSVEMGVGGSIPFVAAFAERYPDSEILIIGASDPTSHYHGPNENVSLDDLRRMIEAQVLALTALG